MYCESTCTFSSVRQTYEPPRGDPPKPIRGLMVGEPPASGIAPSTFSWRKTRERKRHLVPPHWNEGDIKKLLWGMLIVHRLVESMVKSLSLSLWRMSLFYAAALPLSCFDIWTFWPFNSLTSAYLNMILNRPFIIGTIWTQYHIHAEPPRSVASLWNFSCVFGFLFSVLFLSRCFVV